MSDDDLAAHVATLIANSVDVRVGDRIPVGWDSDRNRVYAVVRTLPLEKARKLVLKGQNPEILGSPPRRTRWGSEND